MKPKTWLLILLPVAVTAGLAIGWIDSRPHWDDTGVTAGLVLIVSALFGIAKPERPWLWALAVGIGVPLWNILLHGNFSSCIALAFAFAGAYAGAYARGLFANAG